MIIIIFLEYVLLGIASYMLLQKMNLKFIQKNETIELTELQKKIFLIIMSIFWIIYIPKLYFDSRKEN